MRRGWTQAELASRSRLGKTTISEIERGHLDHVSARCLRLVAAQLDVRITYNVRLPHGELDRLLNAGHAALHEAIARLLNSIPGWTHAPEVSFAFYGERGVIDILAFNDRTGALLVIELKTELVSLEDLLSTMDVRLRHATSIARDRGWHARSVSAWIVFADTETNRRRVGAYAAVLRTAYPVDGRTMRAWLRQPAGTVRSLSFWANFGVGDAAAKVAMRRRLHKRARPTRPRQIAGAGGVSGSRRHP